MNSAFSQATPSFTAAIILAAGASTRLGHPKQLALLNGEPLLARAIRTAQEAGLTPILVVLGANAAEIQQSCPLGPAQLVLNDEWPEGMGSSVRAGISRLGKQTEGVVLMTCDQPAVDAAHLRRLIQAGTELKSPVASQYASHPGEEKRGVPAYFPHTLFSELLLLRGDAGARNLLASAKSLELKFGEVDIDTPAALARARALFIR